MRCKLFTAASVLSLVLCLATVVLWVRSYLVWEAVCGTVQVPLSRVTVPSAHHPAHDIWHV